MVPRDQEIICDASFPARVVLHVDLDAFFVQVERSLNPALRGDRSCFDEIFTTTECHTSRYTLMLSALGVHQPTANDPKNRGISAVHATDVLSPFLPPTSKHFRVKNLFDQCLQYANRSAVLSTLLTGRPMAVQQHADIIAVSYEARKLGVKKHMPTSFIRQRFPSVKLVHVQVGLVGSNSNVHVKADDLT